MLIEPVLSASQIKAPGGMPVSVPCGTAVTAGRASSSVTTFYSVFREMVRLLVLRV